MTQFILMELDDGITILNIPDGDDPIVAAEAQGGQLVAPEPFPTYDAALDALLELQGDEDDRD